MAKNWMFKGFLGDATPDDEIRACINQGKFMIEIAEKIKNNELLTDREREWAVGIVKARGKDQIINPTKYISKEESGAPPDPRRYEAVLRYYSLYTTNFTEPLSYQGSAFLKLPKFP